MVKLFKLQIITQMKLKCMSITQRHLEEAIQNGWEHEVTACNRELTQLKHEAMHPQEVLNSVQHLCLSSGNNLIQKPEAQENSKLA